MRKLLSISMLIAASYEVLAGCASSGEKQPQITMVTADTTVSEVISDPAFGDFGRLLFPVDRQVSKDMTLDELSNSGVYVWYSNMQTDMTVEIINHLKEHTAAGEQVFYNIYSEEERALGLGQELWQRGGLMMRLHFGEVYAIIF